MPPSPCLPMPPAASITVCLSPCLCPCLSVCLSPCLKEMSQFACPHASRTKGAEAKELADKYFLETLVRLHREGEGAPYTGLKDEPVKRIVAISDQAVADGSADEMVKRISGHLATAIGEKFAKVVEARKHKDKSVEAGRAYVEAYVDYTHYVEGIHAAIMSAGGHGHAPAAGHAEKAAPVEHAH